MTVRHPRKGRLAGAITSTILAGVLAGTLGATSGFSDDENSTTTTAGPLMLAAERAGSPASSTGAERSANGPTARPKATAPTKAPPSCNAAQGERASKYPNGQIPTRYLCPLPQRDLLLRADAALAFYELNAAYKRHFGTDACLNDTYRSLAKQRQLHDSMPSGMTARPGFSRHGLGIAADFCGGVQSEGSPQFAWLRANAGKYGWFHPDRAYGDPYEPWHWEFDPSRGKRR
ncbi:M15 family metallopeptidase [Actinomadura kijaniata]|uniref:M15 family metallopeptidase n=1 Tax=Actinomadura kijaniata TaxID=46161 RepID=UPI00082ABA3A|nr:M15 family metallopeptidase [Actinomadura kijaniata]